MNGRHITSWGINSIKNTNGQVMRALFEPSQRWNFKDGGVLYKSNGTEARPFYFDKEMERQSPANDGGLIEIRAFRANGRKRKLANPEPFKSQEQYGIV